MSGLPYDFFHTPAYAWAWQAEIGQPVRLIVYRQGDSRVILPIVLREIPVCRSPALKDAISPYGFPGPIMGAGSGADPDHVVADFLVELRATLREIGCVSIFVRMQPLSPFNELFHDAGAEFVVQGPIVFVDLAQPMGEIRDSYRSNHRRDIQKLARAGFEPFQKDQGWADLFYEIYSQSMQRRKAKSFYFFSREMFYRLEEVSRDNLRLVGCLHRGTP